MRPGQPSMMSSTETNGAEGAETGRATGRWLMLIGPGLAVAATGVGAGDLLAAMLAGAEFRETLLWVIIVGAALKLALNEGVARWQLATGSTLIEGWGAHIGMVFQTGFLIYLVIWSFIVAGGLMSACGVAAHALFPGVGIGAWGAIHSIAALVLVWFGRYDRFEATMKGLIALMVLTLLASVILVGPDLVRVLRGLLVPRLPAGSAATVLSLMGGVGGSVTMLSYGYWIREKGWIGRSWVTTVRRDLGIGYALTAVFGAAMLVLAATALVGARWDAVRKPGPGGVRRCTRGGRRRPSWRHRRRARAIRLSHRSVGRGLHQHPRGLAGSALPLCRFQPAVAKKGL